MNLLRPRPGYFATPLIIYINAAVFIWMALSGVNVLNPTIFDLIGWGGNMRDITLSGEYWRLFTSMFLHAGLMHLLFNMYALLYAGSLLETSFGSFKFLFVYVLCGLFASVSSLYFNGNIVSVGASGAIFGMFGVLMALLRFNRLQIPSIMRQSLMTSVMFFVGFNLFYGILVSYAGIDNAAHIGGLVAGVLLGSGYALGMKKS